MKEDRLPRRKVKKISISLSNDVLEWVYRSKDEMKVSTFINRVLREKMKASGETCDVCDALRRLESRLEALEEGFVERRGLREKRAGTIGHVSIATTRPADVFGELVTIKNVSASNARAVMEELVPFLQEKVVVDREVVLTELFPRTRSAITNDINYWYNACKGVLDHLIERGYVVRLGKGRYKWAGRPQ